MLSHNKQGKEETIVEKVGYDKDGYTVYTKLGNGTETTYTYDKQRERLQEMNLTAAGTAIMPNRYQYDAVDNILGIVNAVDPTQVNSITTIAITARRNLAVLSTTLMPMTTLTV